MEDNTSTIMIVSNMKNKQTRTRHLQARRATIHEAWKERKSVEIAHMSTKNMVTDVLTKPLGGEAFYRFANIQLGWLYPNKERMLDDKHNDKEDHAAMAGVHWNMCTTTAMWNNSITATLPSMPYT